jgi:hypothetical protein
MVRMQIQVPDEVYARAKRVAEVREVSLAELTGRTDATRSGSVGPGEG